MSTTSTARALRFERTAGGRHRAPMIEGNLRDPHGQIEREIGAPALRGHH